MRNAQAFLFDKPLLNLDAKLRSQVAAEIIASNDALRHHHGLRRARPGRR